LDKNATPSLGGYEEDSPVVGGRRYADYRTTDDATRRTVLSCWWGPFLYYI